MAKQIGIFGGSFNPPHLAHLIIAETIRDQFSLDHILWIPNFIPPHKATAGTEDALHRLRMTRLTTEDHSNFSVSSIEIDREGTSFTLDTIQELQLANPDTNYHLIIGGDSLRDFMLWHKPLEIIEKVPLIVYHRPEVDTNYSELPPGALNRISFASAPLLAISSTEIRERATQGKSIRYLVPEKVHFYILHHNLYG